MKKKNLKALKLNKKSISNFQPDNIKGKGVSEAIQVCTTILKGAEMVYSWFYECHPTLDSCACANTINDDSCECTIA